MARILPNLRQTVIRAGFSLFVTIFLCQCAQRNQIIVSVADQKLALLKEGRTKIYPVSTSKFGLGDRPGSRCTPLGKMKIAAKIGGGYPIGTVFKSRRPTGEILKPNTPGRDPIVTRILWLKGLESSNRNAFKRYIYIHGTPEEYRIGSPASYGCVRMKSSDIGRIICTLAFNCSQLSPSQHR
ncbi:MAG: L,D-transpeptidase, partial [Verrucomicrobiota bacterium]